jgi:phosphatidylinositol glycan class T
MYWIVCVLLWTQINANEFHERVTVRPLADGRMLTLYHFTTTAHTGSHHSNNMVHFEMLPMSITLLSQKHNVSSLNVTFAAGRWRADKWGLDAHAAPAGLEMRATFGGTTETVDGRWTSLAHALGGLLCASMGTLSRATHTQVVDSHTRHGMLPR